MNKKALSLSLAGGLLGALTLAQVLSADHTITINGKAVAGKAKVIGGQIYVPLSSLKAGGATATVSAKKLSISWKAEGGVMQTGALEGKVGEWLFNGVWRFRVTSVEEFTEGDRRGYKVRVELRNGSKFDNLALSGSGFESIKLYMSDDNALDVANISDLRDPGLVQAASLNVTLSFYDEGDTPRKPDRLLLKLNPDESTRKYLSDNGAVFTGLDPSFRVLIAAK